MSKRICMAAGIVASSMFAVQAPASVLLDITFEDHALGSLGGQTGGTSGGNWSADGPGKTVISTPAIGTKAASISRDSGANSYTFIDMGGAQLGSGNSAIYFAFDFYRGDDNDRGLITLMNKNSFNNTGLGIEIPNGASPTMNLIVNGGFALTPSTYTIENSKWHRVEFEANGSSGQYDVFVQKEGVAGRLLIGDNVAWGAPNGLVTSFLYYAQGLLESNVVVDNLYVQDNATFPVNRPLEVPEPAALSLLGLSALALRRRK